jgi:hypothetical protein
MGEGRGKREKGGRGRRKDWNGGGKREKGDRRKEEGRGKKEKRERRRDEGRGTREKGGGIGMREGRGKRENEEGRDERRSEMNLSLRQMFTYHSVILFILSAICGLTLVISYYSHQKWEI